MPTGDHRRGRRDNGLVAADYTAAGDVDPRVGEHLLDVLALEGVAAYLHPSTDLHPITRTTQLPDRPTDRLFVDRAHLDTARAYLARLAADAAAAEAAEVTGDSEEYDPDEDRPDPASLDEAWDAIVSGFDRQPPRRSWPSAEDLPDSGGSAPARLARGRDRTEDRTDQRSPEAAGAWPGMAGTDDGSLLDGLDTFGAGLPDDTDEGFTPPAPPPLPRPALPTVLAVVGLVGGLLLLLWPTLLPIAEGDSMLVGFAGLIGGFVTLVWRLRHGDEDDIDPDDGARV